MENEQPRTQRSLELKAKQDEIPYTTYVEDVVIVTGNNLKQNETQSSDDVHTSFTWNRRETYAII